MAVHQVISTSQNQGIYHFQEVSKNLSITKEHIGVAEVLQMQGIVEVTGRAGFDFPNFPEVRKEFRVVYFRMADGFKSAQALLNGLIAIGQPEKGLVEFSKELDTFSVKFYSNTEHHTVSYLEKIFGVLKEEFRFKRILRTVIENQSRFGAESQLLKAELFGGR